MKSSSTQGKQASTYKNLVSTTNMTSSVMGSFKTDTPIFWGDDIEGWLQGVDRFFRVNIEPDKERLAKVMKCSKGSSLEQSQDSNWSAVQ